MKKKYVETIVTICVDDISESLSDEEMESVKEQVPYIIGEMTKEVRQLIADRISDGKIDVKVQVFLHE